MARRRRPVLTSSLRRPPRPLLRQVLRRPPRPLLRRVLRRPPRPLLRRVRPPRRAPAWSLKGLPAAWCCGCTTAPDTSATHTAAQQRGGGGHESLWAAVQRTNRSTGDSSPARNASHT
eukprot:351733-Chlamydomonas_euryale.AAC.3